MYKLLIVDDEPLVRDGLRKSIDWEKYGYVIAGEASNGMEALDMIRQLAPEVVITDMRMGIMDGSDLIPRIKKLYPQIQIVILTAYNEFSYAKVAIDHDVFSYISKPALNEHIISVFCQLKERLDHAIQTRNDLDAYHSYRTNILLTKLLQTHNPSASDVEEIVKLLPIKKPETDYYIALLEIDAGSNVRSDSQDKFASHIFKEQLDFLINTNDCFLEKAQLSLTQTAILISTRKECALPLLNAFISRIHDDFNCSEQSTLAIGISAAFQNLSYVHRAYLEAQKALEQKVQYGYGTVIDYMAVKNLNRQTPVFSTQDVDLIIRHLRSADEHAVHLALTHYFDSLKNVSVDISLVKYTAIDLIAEVILQIFVTQYTTQLILGKSVNPTSDIKALSSVMEIQSYLVSVLEKTLLFSRTMMDFSTDSRQYSPLIQKAITFVTSNYMNSISVSNVASALHISESRFAHSFKDATGKSFVTYLTEYRIFLAKAMIQSGQYKLNEISELVGYKNPITFRKAFSKVTGTVPSKYLT